MAHDDTDLTKKRTTRVGRGGIEVPEIGGPPTFSRSQQGPVGSGGRRGIGGDSAERLRASAAEGTDKPLGQIFPPPSAPVLGVGSTSTDSTNIIQEGPSSFRGKDSGTVTLRDARNLPDIGRPGGGLSVIGMGLSPEDTLAKLKSQTEAVRGLNRMKATGLSEDELAKVDARRAHDSEIFQLTQGGLSRREASARIFDRDARVLEASPGGTDLGGLASLLNAQTAQGQLGLGEERLAQEKTLAEDRAQADSEKSVLKIASQIAADPLTGAIDPTKFATALSQVGSLFGLNPTGGIDGGVSPEALANQLRAEGVPEAEIQQHIKKKFGQ